MSPFQSCRMKARPIPSLFDTAVRMLLIGVVWAAASLTSVGVDAQAPPAAEAPTAEPAEGEAPAVVQPSAVDTPPGEDIDRVPEERPLPPWAAWVDIRFGRVVDILEAIIFFDFWTGQFLPVSIPFVVIWLFGGAAFLTLRMGFINFRAFWHAVRLTRGDYDDESEPGDVSHFQALAAALSATVGLGNIAGVAIAIGRGGPGASFWIFVVGLLGMTSKFTECTLAQIYRSRDETGHVMGGPMRYLRIGLAEIGCGPLGKILAALFMLLCIGASFGGGNAFQVGQSLETVRVQFEFIDRYPWLYGLAMVTAVGLVIVGGIESIGAVAARIVPLMCGAYMVAALYILATHFTMIPGAIATIVTEAFRPEAIEGGFLGVLVIGITRAVFSNEAGIGSAAIVHSAAKTEEPVSEGIVALLEPFIDTVVVCSVTALVVVITGAYAATEMAEAVANDRGARVTLHAFVTGGHEWFAYILYLAVVLFAFSTCISWSYYGERCWHELFGPSSSLIYKILFLVFTFLGAIVTRGNILMFSDLMLLGMSLPNLLGVFLLSGVVRRRLDDYWDRYRQGEIKLTTPPE